MKKIQNRVDCGKFIVAMRRNKFYKVYLKDLKSIKVRSKKSLPPVPSFDSNPLSI